MCGACCGTSAEVKGWRGGGVEGVVVLTSVTQMLTPRISTSSLSPVCIRVSAHETNLQYTHKVC